MATVIDELPLVPPMDRARLVGLSDHEARAWTLARANEYRRFAIALLSYHNALAPIHRLPVEILSKIFEGCWQTRKSLRIVHVCRRWRSVLLKTSGFWADAVAQCFSVERDPLQHLRAILKWSSPRDIQPFLFGFSARIHRSLTPHARRIVSLELNIWSSSHLSTLWGALKSGLPRLRTLSVFFKESDFEDSEDHHDLDDDDDDDDDGWPWIDPKIGSIPATALPCLAEVTVPGGLLPYLAVPSLQRITLGDSMDHCTDFGSYKSFCAALAVCSANLEELVLLNVAPSLSPHHNASRNPVSVPLLRRLQVQDRAPRCTMVLSSIAFPKTTRIHCVAELRPTDHGLRTILPSNSTSTHLFLSATDHVEIRGQKNNTSLRCHSEGQQPLIVNCAGFEGSLRSDDLVDVFRHDACVTRLTVTGMNTRESHAIDLRAFPHLTQLEARGAMVADVLNKLARNEDDGTLMCPDLQMLTVGFPFEFNRGRKSIGGALRRGDVSPAELHLRRQCVELERVLSYRAQAGVHLTRLDFECTEERFWNTHERKRTLGPSSPDCASWRSIVGSLEKLVDGPVVFTGYSFFEEDE